jgi:small ligand-binding sensory domain FIST
MIIVRSSYEEKPAYADSHGRTAPNQNPAVDTWLANRPRKSFQESPGMNCVTALSTARSTAAAFQQVIEKLGDGLAGEPADLCLIFSSIHHADELARLAASIREQGNGRHVLGCTGESMVGEDREIEGSPALAVWSIKLPGVTIRPIRLDEPGASALDWAQNLDQPEKAVLILLGDPFSFRVDDLLKRINQEVRGLRVIGGMASGSQVPRANQLILGDEAFLDGAVAVLLSGPVALRTIVSQGCRPVGHTMIVTKAENNVIRELGRRPAMEALQEMFQGLSPNEQQQIQDGLHIGRVINEYQGSFGRGDFLVRNVTGADDSGAIQITDLVRVGQTIQFHVRDAETADEDLRQSLLLAREQAGRATRPLGALLFTCNGRGTRLFDQPDHDVSMIHEVLGPIPVAGFFAMGEIGPIGGTNFVHGFTASIALFEQPS